MQVNKRSVQHAPHLASRLEAYKARARHMPLLPALGLSGEFEEGAQVEQPAARAGIVRSARTE